MSDILETINHYLVAINEKVYDIEEAAIHDAGYTDLSVSEVHTIDAVGIDTPRNMSEIAASLNITIGTLTVAVNKLEKKGYLERKRSDKDRRIVNVVPLERGKKVYKLHAKIHREMVKASLSQLSEEEGKNLASALEGLDNYLKDLRVTLK